MSILDPTGRPVQPQQKKMLVIPWEAYIAFGIHVFVDGKMNVAVFDPDPVEIKTPEDALNLMRFILSAQGGKPGPADWGTVPEGVRKHFTFDMPQSVPKEAQQQPGQ